jgi:uncharacterized membrane protein YfcA
VTVLLVSVLVGVAIGVLAGSLGVGGGFLTVPYLVLAIGVEQHAAQGTSLLVVLPAAILGSITLQRRGVAGGAAGLLIGLLGALGSVAGARLALALPAQALRYAFAGLLVLLGVRMVRAAWRSRAAD